MPSILENHCEDMERAGKELKHCSKFEGGNTTAAFRISSKFSYFEDASHQHILSRYDCKFGQSCTVDKRNMHRYLLYV